MAKTLLDRLKKGARNLFLAGAIASTLACEPCVTPKINYAPTVNMSSAKNSVKLGESVNLKFDWEDKNGKEDIANYKLGIDKNNNQSIDANEEIFSSSSPVTNFSYTPASTGTFELIAQATDKEGATGKANLEVNVSEQTNPTNHTPIITSNPITTINEKSSYNYPINATDEDEDSLTYSISGPSWLSVNSSGIISGTAPQISEDNNFPVEVSVSDGKDITKQNFTLTEKNLCDISGVLQDTETHTNQAGTIKIFDASNNSLLGTTSSNGNFNFETSSPVSNIILQGKFGDSYVRTINLDGTKDYSGVLFAKNAPTYCDKENLIAWHKKINSGYSNEERYGLKGWDWNKFKGFNLLLVNPINFSSFNEINKNNLINIIGSDYAKKYFGKDLSCYIDFNNKHYSIINNNIVVDEGWIVITPNNSLSNSGETTIGYNPNNKWEIIKALIEIRPDSECNQIDNHEILGHAFEAPRGEAGTVTDPFYGDPSQLTPLSPFYTIMWSNLFELTKPGLADFDEMEVQRNYSLGEKDENIFGTKFLDE